MTTYTRKNKGTCSQSTTVTLADDGTIQELNVQGGCNGNLKGIAQLVRGMKAEDAIARMEGTTCGFAALPAGPDRTGAERGAGTAGQITADWLGLRQKQDRPKKGLSCFYYIVFEGRRAGHRRMRFLTIQSFDIAAL